MPAYFRAILHSYSMLFFSQHRGLAALLVVATLGRPWAGAAGLGAAALAVAGARLGGFRRDYTDLGAYSFNALLVGLALPLFFAPGWALAGLVAVGVGLALLLSVALGGWLGGRGLPFLSLPFVLVMWLLLLGAPGWPALVPAEPSIYWLNDMYAVGGPRLVAVASWAHEYPWPPLLATYLRALSAVVLQDSAWAGLLVAAGLLWHSRIAFSLSVLAFVGAGALHQATGAAGGEPEAYNLGANYLVAAVAVGGVFVVPTLASYGWALLSLPITAVLLGGLAPLLARAGLPGLSLPFCLTALLFLYVLLLRERAGRWLVLVPVQRYSPEANLYAHLARPEGPALLPGAVPLALPFLGAWRCTQGYFGTGPTHQGAWGQALDFAITDAEGRTYQGAGQALSDYYCYNKPVLAPADGVVEEVVQHLADNPIGEVNLRQNWGNTIVLRHAPGLYSQLSHLRPHSARVRPGDAVRRGDVLAACGSSGRSPEPHLHFQVQATPAIGSPTLAYPLAHFLAVAEACPCQPGTEHLLLNVVPQIHSLVRPPTPLPLLRQALHLPPGYRLAVRAAGGRAAAAQRWEVFTDAYNARYLRCAHSGAVAYFEQDEVLLRFTAFYGSRASWLYAFYLAAYRVPLLYLAQPAAVPLPLTVVRRPWLGWAQDAVAPFFQFVKPRFELSWPGGAPGLAARELCLRTRSLVAALGREQVLQTAEITLRDGALAGLAVQQGRQEKLALVFTVEAV